MGRRRERGGAGAGGGGVGCGEWRVHRWCFRSVRRGWLRASTGSGRARGTPRSSQAYAALSIPRLGLRVPVAEGVGKRDVLNKGYVGHYPHTQQAGQAGNFALAGHRNTSHRELFRYINRLRRGTRSMSRRRRGATSTSLTRRLRRPPRMTEGSFGRCRAVPFGPPTDTARARRGTHITLTTCTPEHTSRIGSWCGES